MPTNSVLQGGIQENTGRHGFCPHTQAFSLSLFVSAMDGNSETCADIVEHLMEIEDELVGR